MAARQIIVPGAMPSRDVNGRNLPALLRFYEPDTALTTVATVYTTDDLDVAHDFPIESNAAGRWPAIWADETDTFDVAWSDQLHDRRIATYTDISPADDAVLASVLLAEAAADTAEAAQASAETAEEGAVAAQLASEAVVAAALLPAVATGTRAAWLAARIPAVIQAVGIRTTGYATVGDGGGALYRYVASEPTHTGKFQSADGAWWEIAEVELDPRMLGAKGDGTTDDTTALRNCALISASRVRVRAGTYITQVVTLAQAGQDWVIEGTLKLKSGSNSSMLSITAADVTVSGGGVIDGDRTNQTRGQYVGAIHAVSADGVRVDGSAGLTIQNTAGPGVYFIDCNRCSVINSRIVTTDLMGIFVGTSNGASITDVEVAGNRVDRSADTSGLTQCGILVQYNPSGAISDFRVRGNRVLMPTTSLVVGNICICVRGTDGVCEGNQTRGGYMGLSIDTATDTAVCGNSCLAFTKYGIELPGSSRCAVSGNTLVGPGTGTTAWGVIIDGPATSPTQNTITGNMISGVDYGAGSSGITAAPRNAFVGNNILFGIAGIYLTNADECLVSGNVLKGSLGTGDCVFANLSDKLAMVGNVCRTAGSVLNCYDASATTQTHTICNSNMREGVSNVVAFSGSRTAGTNCSARSNSSGVDYIDLQKNIVEATTGVNPTGSVTAGIGSRYYNTFGGAATTLFVKESGTGTAGWVGK